MTTPSIQVSSSRPELATTIASALLARLANAQERGETPHVGLTGGSLSVEVHRELARLSHTSAVDWSRVVLWWGDDRWAPAASPDRNEAQAREDFIDEVGVAAGNVHAMPASDAGLTLDEAAGAYSATVREFGAGSFEVLMLGIGPDGHVASLFPGHPAAEVADAIVVPVENSPKPPPERLSLTFEAMERSRAVWFIVAGADKADAVAAALSHRAVPGSAEAIECPARVPRGTEETIFWLDQDVAPPR